MFRHCRGGFSHIRVNLSSTPHPQPLSQPPSFPPTRGGMTKDASLLWQGRGEQENPIPLLPTDRSWG
ncbi:hypothetical protein MC7420_2378 [Coleofasciculus chthonoplastes PCC 7420]|uniref:Uncharacterized protein n=1 Tax=Coleofasciculus chthonoplastes PCC 7420 TaxID=118168 RepID=B4W280_9CYAN|nr:hypothetical protein MC7420_2378 [Coleofasciculus chthonoplastes PCC 7420]